MAILCRPVFRLRGTRLYSTKPSRFTADSLGIPIQPSWSVYELLNRYPAPSISSKTLTRLHRIAALVPPSEESHEFQILKDEIERLIKLVEAVKSIPTRHKAGDTVVGKIWPAGLGMPMSDGNIIPGESDKVALLKHAAEVHKGYLVVKQTM